MARRDSELSDLHECDKLNILGPFYMQSLFALTLPPVYSASSGLVEASTRDAIFTSSLAGAVLQSWVS